MSVMSQLLWYYLHHIPLSTKDFYSYIHNYTLTDDDRVRWGFPMFDPKHPDKLMRIPCTAFDYAPDPRQQTCRCGKALSLLDKKWYVDGSGCSYHWGKKSFLGGPENVFFSCCKGISEDGCKHHKYHACNYKPININSFVCTKSNPYPSKDSTNIYALDSEMVYTTAGLEVARVSLVTICGKTVYDSFVRPPNRILDYNTSFSGIRRRDLKGVKTTVADARTSIAKLLNKDSILIGHGLENDLAGLHLLHDNLIDTSILYAHERGFPYRHSLKTLACKYLNKMIHFGKKGHNSVEDAKTCVALVLQKLGSDLCCLAGGDSSKCSSCGECDLCEESIFDTNYISFGETYENYFFPSGLPSQNGGVIVIPKIICINKPVCPTVAYTGFPIFPMILSDLKTGPLCYIKA